MEGSNETPSETSCLEMNNLDLLCFMESVCVLPFCGQKIDSRKVPQELLKKGIQVPVPRFRTLVDSFVQDIRFSCHNLYSQHCCWAIFWFLYSGVLWLGVLFVMISRRNYYVYVAGIIFLLCYILPLFFHLISCFICRLWRKSKVYQKLGNMNHQLSSYNCMATVRNSKFGTEFHLVFFYYNVTPCVDHLTGVLSGLPSVPLQQQNTVFGMIQIATQQPSTSEQQQQQQLQDQPQQQDQQHLEFYRNYAKSLLMSYSAEYLYLFHDEILPEVTPQRHTVQLCCLCQYVEYKTGGNLITTHTSGTNFTV